MAKKSSKPAPADAAWWLGPTVCAPTTVAQQASPPAPSEIKGSPCRGKHAKLSLEGEAEAADTLRCPDCQRANPPDAFYCYFDGKPLFEDLQKRPMHAGSLPFPSPFCFSGGQTCANFNQLALTCNNLWDEAREFLTAGIWSTYFASMGRIDLVAAARQAAKEPDPDRGLNQFLQQFPADPQFLRPPRLALGLTELDLGSLSPGADYTFDLIIRNEGMLLLHGFVASNFDWLVFSEQAREFSATGSAVAVHSCPPLLAGRVTSSEKFFQTRLGCAIPVRVLGSKLRAGLKPVQGEIIVDTNGGSAMVTVRAAVPIRPFPAGDQANSVLAGVRSPRELAIRAKAAPKEAGLLFQQGAVKAWYASNGWTYPIDGEHGEGEGAVQQFFEALGLTKPPQLELDRTSLSFQGKIGECFTALLTLRTREGKPVHAAVRTDQDWVGAGPVKYLGTRVQIPVTVVVPAVAGKTAQAELTILGNARQRFVVPIRVTLTNR